MFFTQKSGRKSAAPKCHNDELSKEIAQATTQNTSAAADLERLLSNLLTKRDQLQQGIYHFNAPSAKS